MLNSSKAFIVFAHNCLCPKAILEWHVVHRCEAIEVQQMQYHNMNDGEWRHRSCHSVRRTTWFILGRGIEYGAIIAWSRTLQAPVFEMFRRMPHDSQPKSQQHRPTLLATRAKFSGHEPRLAVWHPQPYQENAHFCRKPRHGAVTPWWRVNKEAAELLLGVASRVTIPWIMITARSSTLGTGHTWTKIVYEQKAHEWMKPFLEGQETRKIWSPAIGVWWSAADNVCEDGSEQSWLHQCKWHWGFVDSSFNNASSFGDVEMSQGQLRVFLTGVTSSSC